MKAQAVNKAGIKIGKLMKENRKIRNHVNKLICNFSISPCNHKKTIKSTGYKFRNAVSYFKKHSALLLSNEIRHVISSSCPWRLFLQNDF